MQVDEALARRAFTTDWGPGNSNVRDYMAAVCQYSYLTACGFLPPGIDEKNLDLTRWPAVSGQGLRTDVLSLIALTDAIDSIARIWPRIWRRYLQWKDKQGKGLVDGAPA